MVLPTAASNAAAFGTTAGQIYYDTTAKDIYVYDGAAWTSVPPQIKSGIVANTSFGGNPKTSSVTFTTAFASTSYSITVTGEDARTWTIQSKTTGGFTINANSNTALTGNTYWMAIISGES